MVFLDVRRLAAADMWGSAGTRRRRQLIRAEFIAGWLSGSRQTDPEDRATLMAGAGLDVGVPVSAVAYNSYSWTWRVW
jgi:hypothetical protein